MEEKINYLLKKYQSSYVKGEKQSLKTNNTIKRNQRRLEKHDLCDELLEEINLDFTASQIKFIHYMIDRFSDEFKRLHGRAKNETIILSFIFYVKKIEDSRTNLNNYSISKKYGLSDNVFKLIICRVCDDFVKKAPIPCKETTRYDHEILSKNGGKA